MYGVEIVYLECDVRSRPRGDQGVLLTPFDPVLWDRGRTRLLFDFDFKIEIFKPAVERKYGYFCMPVLAGSRFVARVDLKADRKSGRLEVRCLHWEQTPDAAARASVLSALERYGDGVGLSVDASEAIR